MFPKEIVKDPDNLFSGEREIGTNLADFSNDHVNRYRFAQYFVRRNDTVLDTACGVGYGSYLLAEKAGQVYAVDYNSRAIRYARTHWSKQNITYHEHNVLDEDAYPLDQKYDVIVAFEIIEHLVEDHHLLEILAQRLAHGGLCFISSPNSHVKDVNRNPWHIRHYSPDEFRRLARRFFRYVTEFTQIECSVRRARGGDNHILLCSQTPWFKCRVWFFLVHRLLYRVKKKIIPITLASDVL
jgi:SAM-dependent methyltransferase